MSVAELGRQLARMHLAEPQHDHAGQFGFVCDNVSTALYLAALPLHLRPPCIVWQLVPLCCTGAVVPS